MSHDDARSILSNLQVTGTVRGTMKFPGNDRRPHRVSWDQRSFFVDGTRLHIFSGELHYWRLPSPGHWRDIFQKMRGAGFNAVSLYFFWGFHQSAPDGPFDFSGIRDLDLLLTMAREEGLYVIARPGPYINAEISMGGLPAYMTNRPGPLRGLDPDNLRDSLAWMSAVTDIIARHQVSNGGGSVLMYQVENEMLTDQGDRAEFVRILADHVRSGGIAVPVFHNDFALGGRFSDVKQYGLDFYAYDYYPLGFDSTASRGLIGESESTARRHTSSSPQFITESQGGTFTPWGANVDIAQAARYVDGAFTRQWGVRNIGNGVTAFNYYMVFGGTNWGWTGSPSSGFTSYDYGAAIDENRVVTPKLAVQKELAAYQDALPDLASMRPVAPAPVKDTRTSGAGTESTGGRAAIHGYQRIATDPGVLAATAHGAPRMLGYRLADSNSESEVSFTISLDLAPASEVPDLASTLRLDDRNPQVHFEGSWEQVNDSSAYDGTLTRSATAGDRVTCSFKGVGVDVILGTGTDHGMARVIIDGTDRGTITGWVPTDQNRPTQFVALQVRDLPAGEHSLSIEVLGTPATGSRGSVVALDALELVEPSASAQPNTSAAEQPSVNAQAHPHTGLGESPSDGHRPSPTQAQQPATDRDHPRWERIPQRAGDQLHLHGRDALLMAADLRIGEHRLLYTTSQLFGEPLSRVIGGRADSGNADAGADRQRSTVQYLVGYDGDPGETVLRYDQPPVVTASGTGAAEVETTWDETRGELRLNYRHGMPENETQGDGARLAEHPVNSKPNAGASPNTNGECDGAGVHAGVDVCNGEDIAIGRGGFERGHGGLDIRIDPAPGDVAAAHTLVLRPMGRAQAASVWFVRGEASDAIDLQAIDADGNTIVVVHGAEFVRGVLIDGQSAHVTGGMCKPGTIYLDCPDGITEATWNGQKLAGGVSSGEDVDSGKTRDVGSDSPEVAGLSSAEACGQVPGPVSVSAPELTWIARRDDDEFRPDFDDSSWQVADSTVGSTPWQGPGTQGVVLDSNHYGFYEGAVWYRARFTLADLPGDGGQLRLIGNGGTGQPPHGKAPAFMQVWLNGHYLGAATADGTWQTLPIPPVTSKDTGVPSDRVEPVETGAQECAGPNLASGYGPGAEHDFAPGREVVLAVLVHNLGQNLDWSDDGLSRQNRGLFDAELPATEAVMWRLQGAIDRDTPWDTARTIYNVGGLGGERHGWYLPELPADPASHAAAADSAGVPAGWSSTSSLVADRPGVCWYRASVTLDVPTDQDTAWQLVIDSSRFEEGRHDPCQIVLFVNGWNVGVFIGDIGPQNAFTVPLGLLNQRGANTVVAVISAKAAGAGPEAIRLVPVHSSTGALHNLPEVVAPRRLLDNSGLACVVPTIQNLTATSGNPFRLTPTSRILLRPVPPAPHNQNSTPRGDIQSLTADAELLRRDLRGITGRDLPVVTSQDEPSPQPGDIVLGYGEVVGTTSPEAYRIVAGDYLDLRGAGRDGLFWATRSALQALRVNTEIPPAVAVDEPNKPVRGLHIDAARKYFDLDWLIRQVRQAAYVKLNELQLHFSENEGFRVECRSHPEIMSGEFLTRDEVKQLVAEAEHYHVRIVPALDVPGHMAQILAQNPEYRAGDSDEGRKILDYSNPEARQLLWDLLEEFVPLFPSRSWHLGGDEVFSMEEVSADDPASWQAPLAARYPQLAAYAIDQVGEGASVLDGYTYFLHEVATRLRVLGVQEVRAWNDASYLPGTCLGLDPHITVMYWTAWHRAFAPVERFAERGHTVINTNDSRFYYVVTTPGRAYDVHPTAAAALNWSPGIFSTRPAPCPDHGQIPQSWLDPTPAWITGSYFALWCDAPEAETPEQIEDGMRLPLRAMAERVWNPGGIERRRCAGSGVQRCGADGLDTQEISVWIRRATVIGDA
ncbi:beta-galactosidase [Devriesea agamarum]|uniref:beta-galactosidase n=1 Tax=Devriesea agamarum TaxID=472569 RepID=UPI0012EDC668|nr:beta-galactosidase [Devriesea agamarum]